MNASGRMEETIAQQMGSAQTIQEDTLALAKLVSLEMVSLALVLFPSPSPSPFLFVFFFCLLDVFLLTSLFLSFPFLSFMVNCYLRKTRRKTFTLYFDCEIDQNECEGDNGGHNCDSNGTCINTAGSFFCTCNSGFSGDGVTCIGFFFLPFFFSSSFLSLPLFLVLFHFFRLVSVFLALPLFLLCFLHIYGNGWSD